MSKKKIGSCILYSVKWVIMIHLALSGLDIRLEIICLDLVTRSYPASETPLSTRNQSHTELVSHGTCIRL